MNTWQKLRDGPRFGALWDGDSGAQSTTSTTSSAPWAAQRPYLRTGFEAAERDVLNRPYEYYPSSTVVPFNPLTEQSLAAQAERAQAGSPLLGAAQDYTQALLTDPASTPIYDAIMSSVRPGVDTTFARAGRTGGSPAQSEATARGVSRGLAPFMQQAVEQAIPLGREDYFDLAKQQGVGAAYESKEGERLQDSINRWNFAQQEPSNRLGDYMRLIQGNYGTTAVSTGQTSGAGVNPLLLASGAGLGLAGLPTSGGGSVGGNVISGLTVICTELNRTEELDDATMIAADAFGLRYPRVADGYRVWAVPVVRAMQKSRIVRKTVKTLAMPLIRKLAEGGPDFTPIGIILAIGVGICWCLGTTRETVYAP